MNGFNSIYNFTQQAIINHYVKQLMLTHYDNKPKCHVTELCPYHNSAVFFILKTFYMYRSEKAYHQISIVHFVVFCEGAVIVLVCCKPV